MPYRYAQLTVCTTHQLLRFYHAFDNLIIDEVDAFPFAANDALLFASRQAVKEDGGCLYLTATPGRVLLRRVKRGSWQSATCHCAITATCCPESGSSWHLAGGAPSSGGDCQLVW